MSMRRFHGQWGRIPSEDGTYSVVDWLAERFESLRKLCLLAKSGSL